MARGSSKPDGFRVAIYGLFLREGRALMTRSRTPGGLILNFPGGALEPGEDPEACLIREFREETGLIVRVGKLLYASRRYHPNPFYAADHQYHTYYEIERAEGDLAAHGNGDDVASLEWVDLMGVAGEPMLAQDREFLEALPESYRRGSL